MNCTKDLARIEQHIGVAPTVDGTSARKIPPKQTWNLNWPELLNTRVKARFPRTGHIGYRQPEPSRKVTIWTKEPWYWRLSCVQRRAGDRDRYAAHFRRIVGNSHLRTRGATYPEISATSRLTLKNGPAFGPWFLVIRRPHFTGNTAAGCCRRKVTPENGIS